MDRFRIRARDVWTAFQGHWNDETAFRERFTRHYENSRSLNRLMLGSATDPGFLGRVLLTSARHHEVSYIRERYTIDAALVSGQAFAEADALLHPHTVHVALEHEVSDYSFTEMWKLVHWRCPLKVLVTYDWEHRTPKQGPTRRFRTHLTDLGKIVRNGQAYGAESRTAEYLLILCRRHPQDKLMWFAFTISPTSGSSRSLTGR